MIFFQTPQAEAYGHSPRVLKVFFVFFLKDSDCKTCCDIDQTYLGGGFKYNIFDFQPLLWEII